ncbi:MAG: LOG family protein [Nanoarchaeota archaeon]
MKKRVTRFDRETQKTEFRVAIFGSARIKKNDPAYKSIYALAKMIGSRDIDIVTGGGPGLMEAASEGHAAAHKGKGHSLGLLIKLPEKQRESNHLNIKREFHRFSERLDTFMQLSNAVVVAPGGLGTLLEFFYAWQLIQVRQICDIPLILLGDHYQELIAWIKKGPLKHRYMEKQDMKSLFLAKTPQEAMHIIEQAHVQFKRDGKNICLNIKKYRPTIF